jgi:hypothetical protein
MEGFWGMGTTVSSYSMARRLEVGSPGGGRGGTLKKGENPEVQVRRALADRIEDKLTTLLSRVEEILKEDRNQVLALAHALEAHKTMSGEDVVAVMEHTQGPLVDGRPYANEAFLNSLSDYHLAAARAHREHSQQKLGLPTPEPEPEPEPATVSPWAIVTDDLPGLNGQNGHNPESS